MSVTKEQRLGIISTIVFLMTFIGLLLFFGFSAPFPPPEEEGILINFGTTETGSGIIEPKPAEPAVEETTPPVPKSEAPKETKSTEKVLTQDFDEAAAIEEKKKADKKRQQEIIEKKKKDQELEKQRQEELERQRIEEENRKKEEQQKAINDRAKNAFAGKNASGDNSGEGDTKGVGNQGDSKGDINSKNRIGGPGGGNGISFSLNGRSYGSTPPKPNYSGKSEGKVVVEITVDQNGNVVSARPGVQGTTTPDEQLHEAAKKAALITKFDSNPDAPALQKGTITYIFILQ